MSKFRFVSALASLFLVTSTSISFADTTPIPGALCSKTGSYQVFNGIKYSCVKVGNKSVWDKGLKLPILAQPISTKTAISFENLYQLRKSISYLAWLRTSETVKRSKSKLGAVEIYTGPNTKPFFDNYPLALSLVSRAFPNQQEPTRTIVIRFKYADLDWAKNTLKEKLSTADFEKLDSRENGTELTGRCDNDSQNCRGAMEQAFGENGELNLIIQGIANGDDPNDPTGKARFYSGMVEAHEYFHGLQAIPITGKSDRWPLTWFVEGSAEWVQNVAINSNNFKAYSLFLDSDCNGSCVELSQVEIAQFISTEDQKSLPTKFERFLNYSLGSRVIEALVAIKGQDALIEMYKQMATKITFAQAFKNTYGVDWNYAIPILSKVIYANILGI